MGAAPACPNSASTFLTSPMTDAPPGGLHGGVGRLEGGLQAPEGAVEGAVYGLPIAVHRALCAGAMRSSHKGPVKLWPCGQC